MERCLERLNAFWIFVLLVLLVGTAAAQERPAVELFTGYQYFHANTFTPAVGLNGWDVSVTANANRWFGIEADSSGTYGSGAKVHTLMGGPKFTYRGERWAPFAHALFGGAIRSAGGNTDTAVAMAVGGGLDITLSRHIALRPAQFDYLLTGFSSATQHQFRYSGGLVFRFGGQ
jgi:hypothetical protein